MQVLHDIDDTSSGIMHVIGIMQAMGSKWIPHVLVIHPLLSRVI